MEKITFRERLASIKIGIWGVLAPIIILVTIYTGFCTALESAAVVLLYSLIVTFARKKLELMDIMTIVQKCCLICGMIIMLVVGASILGYFMTMLRLANTAVEWMTSSGLSPFSVMVILMLIYFVLGMFLELVSVMLITLPVVYPMVISIGFDGIWFAVLVTLAMEIACITPPVGLNLYIIKGLTNAPLSAVIRGTFPFFLVMLIGLLLIALFPPLSTWLPSLMA